MHISTLVSGVILYSLLGLGAGPADSQQADRLNLAAEEYDLFLPEAWYVGEIAGLEFNSRGHMFVFNRGEHALLEFDETGKFVREIGQGLFRVPHGLRVDEEDNIWTTDQETHQVLKFNPEGRVVLILGRRDVPGTGLYERGYSVSLLNQPSDTALDSNGNIYVADGGNFRIVKYNKHGEFLKSWGTKGKGPGEFDFPHSLVFDGENRLYVTDRENGRVQIFSPEGEFISQWDGFGNPYVIQILEDGTFLITDARAGKILHLNAKGKVLDSFGQWGKEIGDFGFPHGFDITGNGEIFVGEILNWRVQRLIPSNP